MQRLILALLLTAGSAAAEPMFTFRSEFWMNLHHFLHVLGRARNRTPDSGREAVKGALDDRAGFDQLPEEEQRAWEESVAYYQAALSPKDPVFDRDLVAITRALARAGDAESLAGVAIPAETRRALERAAPVYRKVWWPRHARSNRERATQIETLLAQYGEDIAKRLAAAYRQAWAPRGYVADMTAYANWAGAYSVTGGPIVMGSCDPGTAGSRGLETIFHEAMHQWDDAVIPLLNRTAAEAGVSTPRDLFHSLIFYTAGYVVSQVVPGHRPYAEPLWARGALPGRAALDRYWLPYLRGEETFEAATRAVVSATASAAPARRP